MSLSQRGGQNFAQHPSPTIPPCACVRACSRSAPHVASYARHSYGVSLDASCIVASYNGTSLRHALAPVTPRLDKGLHHRSLGQRIIIISTREKNTRPEEEEAAVATRYLISVARKLGLMPSRFLCGSDVFGALRRPRRPPVYGP